MPSLSAISARRSRTARACASRTPLLGQQVARADRDQDAVDRLARPVLLQEIEEALPGAPIDRRMAVLGGVAAGRVDQHRLAGEEPVAVARAADAAHLGAFAALARRKMQAGAGQRGGLAGAGRPDHHVPRQLVEHPAAGRGLEAGVAEPRQRALEALGELGLLRRRPASCSGSGFRFSTRSLVGAAHARLPDQIARTPGEHDHEDDHEARDRGSRADTRRARRSRSRGRRTRPAARAPARRAGSRTSGRSGCRGYGASARSLQVPLSAAR